MTATDTTNTTESADFALLIRLVDEVLVELGTSSLVDGRKARDMVLDIRSLLAGFATPAPVEEA